MAKIKEREQATSLRKRGNSIGEIAKQLGVSKSTVSCWCRDITLSHQAIKNIASKSKQKSTEALLRFSEEKRRKRQVDILVDTKKGASTLGVLSDRDVYCLGLGLYWGEGYKQGNQEFGFTNSDPQMIKFYLFWLKRVFHVSRSDLILRVSINAAHEVRVKEVESYWSDITGVSKQQFTKCSLIKSQVKKQYKNKSTHMGTLRVKVKKGTNMRREVIGAIKSIAV